MRPAKPMLFLVSLALAGAAHAATAVVDSLTYFKNNSVLSAAIPFNPADLVLNDGFNNGNPALSDPRVDGTTNSYSFLNALVPPVEANGLLTITANASTTIPAPNAQGDLYYSYGVRLNTNTSDTSVNGLGRRNGLSRDTTWSVGTSFVPLVPTPGSLYQIRLSDFGIGAIDGDGSDVLALQVFGGASGTEMRLVKQNFIAGTVSVPWSKPITIPAAASQIRMGFAHLNADTDTINAYYSFFNGDTSLGGEAIGTTGSIFSDEMLTRFEVRVATPVPEPATLALWALGLGALALQGARRRR